MSEPSDKDISRALGEELRRAREALDLSRAQLVERLPSGIGDRTLLSYEHGTRHLTMVRFIELCAGLTVDSPTLHRQALQRARIYTENMNILVDLKALINDGSDTFRPLVQWARNALNNNPSGIMEVEPAVVQHLALFLGCTHQQLAKYLARLLPDHEKLTALAE